MATPHPEPTRLKMLKGTATAADLAREIHPAATSVQPPYELSYGAQLVWSRLAPDLIAKGVLTAWDIDQFAMLCDAVATYRECRALLDEQGYTARGSAGGVIKNPHWQVMTDCATRALAIGSRFGLTPSDRAHLSVSKDDTEGERGAERLLS